METIDFNEVIRDPETISVVGGLLPVVTPENRGLFPSEYYYYACPITVYDRDYRKIKITFTDSTHYVFVHIQTKTSAYLIDLKDNKASCNLLYGKVIPIFINLSLSEIYIGVTDYRKAKIIHPFGNSIISFERFKDGKTAPTEEDGIKVL